MFTTRLKKAYGEIILYFYSFQYYNFVNKLLKLKLKVVLLKGNQLGHAETSKLTSWRCNACTFLSVTAHINL